MSANVILKSSGASGIVSRRNCESHIVLSGMLLIVMIAAAFVLAALLYGIVKVRWTA